MSNYLPVAPGIDMTAALRRDGLKVPTKKWLRDYLRTNPQKDFRNLGYGGTYVNGGDALRLDLTLECSIAGSDGPAIINFQPTTDNEWGYQAVVR